MPRTHTYMHACTHTYILSGFVQGCGAHFILEVRQALGHGATSIKTRSTRSVEGGWFQGRYGS